MESTAKKNYALPIIIVVALFFMISLVTGLRNPFDIIIKNQFATSNFMSQLGNAANSIAYAFMGIPTGMLLQKIGYKKTALLAIIVGFCGVGISYLSGVAGSYAVYLTGAFVSGFSMCMLNIAVNPMLNTLGGGGNKGNQLVQVAGSANSIGTTIVPVLVGCLIGDAVKAQINGANPALFSAMNIFAIVFTVSFCMQISEPHMVKENEAKTLDKRGTLSFRHFILGAIAIFLYVGVEVGIPNFMNLFATSSKIGIDPAATGSIMGTYWFLVMIERLFGVSFGAKISSKAVLSSAVTVGMILILTAIFAPATTKVSMSVFLSDISFDMVEVPVEIMFMALCSLCTSIMQDGILNLAIESLGKYTAAASGIFMMMVCGRGILPLIQGAVADAGGFITSFWVVFLGLTYLLYYALIGSKNVNKNIPVE